MPSRPGGSRRSLSSELVRVRAIGLRLASEFLPLCYPQPNPVATQKNQLYYGDNLEVLKMYVKDESVDLVYLDPPFN
jgi:hypothetical protein